MIAPNLPPSDSEPGPPQTGPDGGRTPRGQFAKGNRCSKRNGTARKAAQFRSKLYATVSAKDFGEITGRLVQEAKAGESWAVKLALEYLIGPPRDFDLEERLAKLEATLHGDPDDGQ